MEDNHALHWKGGSSFLLLPSPLMHHACEFSGATKQIQTRTPAIAVTILLRSAASELMMADWIETRTPTIPVTVSTFEVCDIKNGDTILAVVSPMWALPNHYGSSLKTPKCKVQIINEVYKRAREKMPYVHVNIHWRF